MMSLWFGFVIANVLAMIAGPVACELVVKARTGAKGATVMLLLGALMILLLTSGLLAGGTLLSIHQETNFWLALIGACLLMTITLFSYAGYFLIAHSKQFDRENGKSPLIIRN